MDRREPVFDCVTAEVMCLVGRARAVYRIGEGGLRQVDWIPAPPEPKSGNGVTGKSGTYRLALPQRKVG